MQTLLLSLRMRRWPCLLLVASLVAAAFPLPPEYDRTTAAYRWLINQQSPSGLLGNQEDDNVSGVYANALAAICYLNRGDAARARRVFDFFLARHEQALTHPGGFHQLWDANTGEPFRDSDRWVGDNAWLLIALNRHRALTGETRYVSLAKTIAAWIISLQDQDGGILSGFNKNGAINVKSTEGNLDCYAALTDYPRERARVRSWLETSAWTPSEKRFRMGSTVAESALDGTSWGIAALGADYATALVVAERLFRCTHFAEGARRTVTGFSDRPARDRIWFEGTGQMAVAYRVAGRAADADFLLAEMRRALVPGRADPAAAGLPWYSGKPDRDGGAERIFTPSQAWYLLAEWQINPMGEPPEKP